jgi:lysozyme
MYTDTWVVDPLLCRANRKEDAMSHRHKHWDKYKHHHPAIAAVMLIGFGFYTGQRNSEFSAANVATAVGKTLESTGEILSEAGEALNVEEGVTGLKDTTTEFVKEVTSEEIDTASEVIDSSASSAMSLFYPTNQACIDIIKASERVRLEAYRGPTGAILIGYGHSKTAQMGMTINILQAERLLRQDLQSIEQDVSGRLTSPVNENQFSAMVCLTYNIGIGAFATSTVLKEANAGNHRQAADAFLMWNKARIDGRMQVLEHLDLRRQAERALYLK